MSFLTLRAVRVTNNDDTAVAFGLAAARMMEAAITGEDLQAVVQAGLATDDDRVRGLMCNIRCSRGARVAVVQSAEMGDGANGAGAAFDFARLGSVAIKREVAARAVVILHVVSKYPAEMIFAQRNDSGRCIRGECFRSHARQTGCARGTFWR